MAEQERMVTNAVDHGAYTGGDKITMQMLKKGPGAYSKTIIPAERFILLADANKVDSASVYGEFQYHA
ncbi:hypothetical protein V6N13_119928 [Hibiscus sabdariffa]|uniref:Uncharacterized protein n=1 Tax=Hibiscus sabdariffa TaxID=183260 RepID=A0ABR2E4G7_9ROSI